MTSTGTSNHNATAVGRVESYRADELVVGIPYAAEVNRQLVAWYAEPDIVDTDPRLGLAQVKLSAGAAVEHLRREHRDWVDEAAKAAREEVADPSDLDLLLRCLRRHFRLEYARWVPTIGKNRIMEEVEGSYVIDGGSGDGRPTGIDKYVIDGGTVGGPAQPVKPPYGSVVVGPRGTEPGVGVRVGVVDTRLATHPWLAGGYVASAADLRVPRPGAPIPWTADHATFVTGLVLRSAPGAVVVLRGGLNDDAKQDSWSIARAIADLGSSSADVVNLSFGCATDDGQPPLVLSAAIASLGPRTVVVAAAGNHGEVDEGSGPSPSWPAALDNVVAVGALDGSRRARFSPEAPWVDAMAPGVGVASICDVNRDGKSDFARWSGTSFAAATVSGAIAARITPAMSAVAAWQELKDGPAKDPAGRPKISPPGPKNWPPDQPSGDDAS